MNCYPVWSTVSRLEALVQGSARKYGDRLAVSARDEKWTYAELDAWSNRVARWLSHWGVVAGDRIGIWALKSCRTIACIQGVLRLGAAYVPIDPSAPIDYADAVTRDCDLRVLITDSVHGQQTRLGSRTLCLADWTAVASFPGACLDDSDRSTEELAYILYTSGSTGTPKGVCISHSNALAFVRWAVETIRPRPQSIFSNHASLNFDLSVFDFYCAFACGALVSVIPEEIAFSHAKLVHFLESEDISIWYSVPSALVLMSEYGALLTKTLPDLEAVIFAGEVFPIVPLRKLRRHFAQARFFNFYGPTETNVCASYEVTAIPDDQVRTVPIGKSASGNRLWLVKEDGDSAAPGEAGELWVDGPTVMMGYWGRTPHRGPYATGDVCRLLQDGSFDYCGRRDRLVKVRGFRVELGQIEALLSHHPAIREVTVLSEGDELKTKLVAYAVASGSPAPTLIEIKSFLMSRLPHYMLIDRLFMLPALPRTANGKVDYLALRGKSPRD